MDSRRGKQTRTTLVIGSGTVYSRDESSLSLSKIVCVRTETEPMTLIVDM